LPYPALAGAAFCGDVPRQAGVRVQQIGVAGFPPAVLIQPRNPERAKYAKLWERDEYRVVAPGEQWVMQFLEQARPPVDAEVIDFGCGTGRAGLILALLGKMKTTLLDFTSNCLDAEVAETCKTQPERIRFVEADLTSVPPVNAAYGYCCDVMEHIPTADVPRVLLNILASAQHVFFAISTTDDVMGALIGEPLHLTVQPAVWWREQLTKAGALIHWHEERADCCAFYCSAWHDVKDLPMVGRLNVPDDVLEAQTQANIAAKYKQLVPHAKQDRECVILCGGPSMNDDVDTIRKLRASGAALITVNGAYNWALDHGLEPSAQILLDAREFNARFTKPATPYTQYMLASQAHPAAYEGLPWDKTLQWHCGISDANAKLAQDIHGAYYPMMGGSTVVLRAIPLLRMLGFWKLHLFGFDSCVRKDAHHAYAQPENDGERLIPVSIGGKVFDCAPWMVSQAAEFRDLIGVLGNEVNLAVYGDGLIAAMMAAGAELSTEGN